MINLVESAGANLLKQSEVFIRGGRSFANLAKMSAIGIPTISIVHGSSTAGGAYLPGLSDQVIVVKNKSKIFLAGPPLLKAALGEIATVTVSHVDKVSSILTWVVLRVRHHFWLWSCTRLQQSYSWRSLLHCYGEFQLFKFPATMLSRVIVI